MFRAPLTIGIEEEYQIIDPETRRLAGYVAKILERGRIVLGDKIKNEFMQSQIEVGSKVCANIQEAREEVIQLRQTVNEIAKEQGLVIAAASTHPFSKWQEQEFSPGERYDDLVSSMQDVVRRLLIFGLHVHIGIGKDSAAKELTIDILNQIRYFLPHILALSTSSPFWHGRLTGLKSYRSVVFQNMPRTGIAPIFRGYSEYQQYANVMFRVGALGAMGTEKDSVGHGEDIVDVTKIWWDARPHPVWGTLEIRVSDMCTTVDEAISIAALIQALVAKFIKLRNNNRTWRIYPNHFIEENKWRAVRYGVEGKLIDFGRETEAPMKVLVEEIIEVVDDVLDDLGIRREVEHLRTMCYKGTSADRQIATYKRLIAEGFSEEEALQGVVDQLIEETHRGWSAI